MQLHTIKVVEKTSKVAQLRFFSPEGKLIGERELSIHEIERFAAKVERKYHVLTIDPMRSLPALGRELYEWLDGPATRWLARALKESNEGMTLRIDVTKKLRHLPWELLYTNAGYLCSAPFQLFTPARLVADAKPSAIETHNRPLRMLFMACSAEDVQPLLDFETEERLILQSASQHKIELFVEESGSLDGLRHQVEAFGRGHFDVFHLTGHADVDERGPHFLMENDQGLRQDVTADEIAKAFQGNWPRLIFLSGCKTGQSPKQGYLPSFCEAMVRAGAPAVLGWALPVYDATANLAAGELYGHLAAGKSIDESVARTRLHLLQEKDPDWHLLRLYINATPLDGMVTAPKSKGRDRLMVREAASEFFDAGAKVEVCKREHFVGRRRSIQRCLRTLQSSQGDNHYAEGVLLSGMGGLGKSSLAARLCERMDGYKRILFVGALDELGFITKVSDALGDPEAIGLLNQFGLSLTQQLRNLFVGPLATQPIIFVLDDFEQNLEASGGGYIVKSEPLEALEPLLTAIRDTGSESRVIVTSRYQFPLPSPLRLREEPLETLRGGELAKKLTRLAAFSSSSSIEIEEKTRERARTLGAGNPRLLEWLNKILVDGPTDATPIMDAMEAAAEKFRENILLSKLLAQLPGECRRLIALASVYELPVDRQAIAVAVNGPIDPHLGRASSLGLIESGVNPATGQSRYFVSPIVLPQIESDISVEVKTEAIERAVNHLYQARMNVGVRGTVEEEFEIFRLAMIVGERKITAEIGCQIARIWVNNHRYREAESLCQSALKLCEDNRLLLDLARAQAVLGKTSEALQNYERALSLCPNSDLNERSGILFNLAMLTSHQGDMQRALELWQQSLTLKEQIGSIQGKAATLSAMAGIVAKQGNIKYALELWKQSIEIDEQIDDIQNKAATLHNMAGVIAQAGDIKYALELLQQSLDISELVSDVKGKAATLHRMAGLILQQGHIERALNLMQQSLVLKEQIGDVIGIAATLHNMAHLSAQRGDVNNALDLWQRSLSLKEQIGDIQGKAVSLTMMAVVIAQQGDIKHALSLCYQSLSLLEQVGDVQAKATTLSNIAWLTSELGDFEESRRLYLEAAGLLIAASAWLDLIVILSNLSTLPINRDSSFLAQAAWLTIRLDASAMTTLNVMGGMIKKLGPENEISPLLGAVAFFSAQRCGQDHPNQLMHIQSGLDLIKSCAEARNISQLDQIKEWITAKKFNDPNHVLPTLLCALEVMIGEDQWLFDRELFGELSESEIGINFT